MSKTTKILLIISLTGFVIGCTDLFWGLGKPVGAIFLGLFLISKLLEKEVALFDQEERERFAQAERVPGSAQNKTSEVPNLNAALRAPAKS